MPQIGDVYRGIVKGRLVGVVETRNMFAYTLAAANCTDQEAATAIENQLDTMFTALKGDLANVWSGYEVVTEKYYPAGANPAYWQQFHNKLITVTGTEVGDLSGYQSAGLIVLKTAAKRVVGRKFIAGVPENMTAVGAIVGDLLTSLGVFALDMLDTLSCGAGGSLHPGVLDKNGTFREYTGYVVGSIISTMRRRKPGYGI